jgi:hypothetical protein
MRPSGRLSDSRDASLILIIECATVIIHVFDHSTGTGIVATWRAVGTVCTAGASLRTQSELCYVEHSQVMGDDHPGRIRSFMWGPTAPSRTGSPHSC